MGASLIHVELSVAASTASSILAPPPGNALIHIIPTAPPIGTMQINSLGKTEFIFRDGKRGDFGVLLEVCNSVSVAGFLAGSNPLNRKIVRFIAKMRVISATMLALLKAS